MKRHGMREGGGLAFDEFPDTGKFEFSRILCCYRCV